MVDNHPSRHDPSHIVTHRIQCAISQFADYLITACSPHVCSKWKGFLRALNTVVCNFVDSASSSILQFMNLHMSISPIDDIFPWISLSRSACVSECLWSWASTCDFKYENIFIEMYIYLFINVNNASDFPDFTFLHIACMALQSIGQSYEQISQ